MQWRPRPKTLLGENKIQVHTKLKKNVLFVVKLEIKGKRNPLNGGSGFMTVKKVEIDPDQFLPDVYRENNVWEIE